MLEQKVVNLLWSFLIFLSKLSYDCGYTQHNTINNLPFVTLSGYSCHFECSHMSFNASLTTRFYWFSLINCNHLYYNAIPVFSMLARFDNELRVIWWIDCVIVDRVNQTINKRIKSLNRFSVIALNSNPLF